MIIAKKGGGGGGSSGREWSDNVLSIDYAKVLDLISEGPIKGLVNGQEGIIIDGVRVKGSNGNVNIQGIKHVQRTGEQHQSYIEGFTASENQTSVGVELLANQPVIRQINNPNADYCDVRVNVPSLQNAEDNGNIFGTVVTWKIEVKPNNGDWTTTSGGFGYTKLYGSPSSSTGLDYPLNTDSGYDTLKIKLKTSLIPEESMLSVTKLSNNHYIPISNLSNAANKGKFVEFNIEADKTTGYKITLINNRTGELVKAITNIEGGRLIKDGYAGIDGKSSSGFVKETRVPLPKGGHPWQVKVTRITEDSHNLKLQNKTYWDTYSEVIDRKFTYPNSAIIAMEADSSRFTSIHTRGYHVEGMLIQVPSNREVVNGVATYAGIWNGTFKTEYSNNPVWCLYDILVSDRYGIGDFVKPENIDKYSLYAIGRYCDELVDDGYGGKEPRFTLNAQISSREEAFDIIQKFVGLFRGISFWAGGGVFVSADTPTSPVACVTNANVIGGDFTYQTSSNKTVVNGVLVKYFDKRSDFKDSTEYVQDDASVKVNGLKIQNLTAWGCTSRGQARRLAKWYMATASDNEVVTFKTGLDMAFIQPSDVIKVSDVLKSTTRFGGRILSFTKDYVVVDKVPDGNCVYISFPDSNGIIQRYNISYITGNEVHIAGAFDASPNCIFVIENQTEKATLWKVTDVVKENDNTFSISAIAYDPDKFSKIDQADGKWEEWKDIQNEYDKNAPDVVNDLTVKKVSSPNSAGIVATNLEVSWRPPITKNAVVSKYAVQWRYEDGNWTGLPDTSQLSVSINNVDKRAGAVRVAAIGATGLVGPFVSCNFDADVPEVEDGSEVSNFRAVSGLFAIDLLWDISGKFDKYILKYNTTGPDDPHGLLAEIDGATTQYRMYDVPIGVEHYFFLYPVSQIGTVAEEPLKCSGMCIKDPTLILEQLNNSIGYDQLNAELLKPIESIGGIDANLDSIIQSILEGVISDDVHFRESVVQEDDLAVVQQTIKVELGPDGALAQRIDLVVAKVDENTAAIYEEATARANADGAQATKINLVVAESAGNTAAIKNEATARASADSALSKNISTVQTQVNGNTASIESQALSINGLKAQYTLKVNAGGKVAGMGIYADSSGSVVDFLADRFYVSTPQGTGSKQVFSVGTINGVSAVGVSGNLITDGSITGRTISATSVIANTLNIAGNAVTVPQVATYSSFITGVDNMSLTDCASFYVTIPQAGFIFSSFTALQGFASTSPPDRWYFSMFIDGVKVCESAGTVPGDSVALSGAKYCSAGSREVIVKWSGDTNITLKNRTLYAVGAMR